METKIRIAILFSIIPIFCYCQIKPDSLVGTYAGEKWFKWKEDPAWTINPDTAYILTIDTSGCWMHFISPAYLPSGIDRFETSYDFCNGNSTNWVIRFYSKDSLMIIFNNISRPPPNNIQVWSARFFGKKICSLDPNVTIEIDKNQTINIYPNPCSEKITIECTSPETMELRLFDIIGNLIIVQITNNNQREEIDITNLNKGIYFLYIRKGKQLYYRKIIKN